MGGASVAPVATILLVGVDLFFRGKLDGLLEEHRLVTSDSVDAPDLVIAGRGRVADLLTGLADQRIERLAP